MLCLQEPTTILSDSHSEPTEHIQKVKERSVELILADSGFVSGTKSTFIYFFPI